MLSYPCKQVLQDMVRNPVVLEFDEAVCFKRFNEVLRELKTLRI